MANDSHGTDPRFDESEDDRSLTRRVSLALAAARANIAWERFWPAILPALGVLAAFCIVSWLGLWSMLSPWVRIGLVAAFGIAFLASLFPLVRVRLPGAGDAVRRVETTTKLRHRPISSLRDTLSGDVSDEARVLWDAHRRRTADTIGRLSAGTPDPRVAERDPFALRAIVVLLFVIAAAYAGSNRFERIAQAFMSPGAQLAAAVRLDAWVSPPSYTSRPPVLLTGAPGQDTIITVPAGSNLVVRSQETDGVSLVWTPDEGADETFVAERSDTDARVAEISYALKASGTAEIRRGSNRVALWRFETIGDMAPSIELTKEPEALASGALRLVYEVKDDYGVISAKARIVAADAAANAEPLVPAPDFDLTLPQLRARQGSAQTVKDLTAHPWAGAEVILTLEAGDDAEQSGLSDPTRFTLPARQFREPLARALVEQRRNLALDRTQARSVWRALELLALAPDEFDIRTPVYLGLRSAAYRLRLARDDDGLRDVVDLLWEMALSIEDGDLSDVARDLRAAQEALQNALENNASDEEIARLVDELRQALNQFMQEMARRMQDPGNITEMPNMENLQTVTPQDLNKMLDSIENMARSGARDQAQQLLSELRNMLESLRAGQMPQSAQQQQMQQSLEELADIIRRQQELMDQTFRQNQQNQQGQMNQDGQQGQQGQPGDRQGQMMPGQGGQQGGQPQLRDGAPAELEGLERAQRELREQLAEMMRRMQESGHNGQEQFGRAGDSMGNAEGALGEGETGSAVQEQAQALEALRNGAQQLAEQLAQSMGMDGQNGQARGDVDPMGRPNRTQGPDLGNTVQVPDEIDAARARQILEELRRRLSDTERPRLERDYLERLLGR
ncbi:TIGR02302 family protein [Tepidamorphus sp. 3E244]|uniref:TIGR02302 family protein n=1 Tax=Tepidamorphus sp. 3E244 TaxID=3385498 RepID=UPI0038FCE899